MDFPKVRRKREPETLTFAIKITFIDPNDERRALTMLGLSGEPSEQEGRSLALTDALLGTSKASFLNPERVRVIYRRGSVEALVTLEGLRLAYELFSDYDDFMHSAELLLHQLEGVAQEVLSQQDMFPIVTSGTIVGLRHPTHRVRSLAHGSLKFLLLTQIGVMAVVALAVSRVDHATEWVDTTTHAPTILQHVIHLASIGIGCFAVASIILIIVSELTDPK